MYGFTRRLFYSSLNAKNGFQGGSPGQILHLKTVQQRNDLLESQIYLCHPYVLNSFTDNFDFENMNDFIKGVLVDEEVSGYTMYIDVFKMKFLPCCLCIYFSKDFLSHTPTRKYVSS